MDGDPPRAVRVLLYHRCDDGEVIQQAYRRISDRLAGVEGQLGNELLHSVHEPECFVVLSRWRDLDAFTTWESGAHQDTTIELRPYRDFSKGQPFAVYVVSDAQ